MKINCLLLLLIIFSLLPALPGTAQSGQVIPTNNLPSHPRLLLLKNEEAAIRSTIAADEALKKVHQAVVDECEKIIPTPPIERIQVGRRLLDKSRECLRRVFYLSYAYRLSGQEKYLKRAEQEMLAVAAFSDWNPAHFLDVAEMTLGMAIGYDWLFTGLPETSRIAIREAILKKGIEPSLDEKHNGWLQASHNWNQVCNTGIAYGALAIYEDQPELARRIIQRSAESIVLPMKDYLPDGAYPEGYSYWGYGTSFNVLLLNALERLPELRVAIPQNAGFLKTAGYLLHMTGPSGNCFDYSDANSSATGELQPAMFWFARRLNQPSLLWVERSRLNNNAKPINTKERLLPAVLVWSKGIDLKDIREPDRTSWVGAGKNPVALMRTSWSNPNAIYVGFKGGSPSVNHGHMDVGSFVMEANGVRWAMDFGMQNYNSLESKGVDLWGREQNAQRWQVFRYNNFVHNTLTVNGQLQQVEGHAPITGSSGNNPAFRYAASDLTSLYQGLLTKADRGVAIAGEKYVIVRDEVETASEDCTIRWTMLTPASVRITGKDEAELTQDGKKLILKVQQPARVTMKTWSTEPPHDYDAPNPGTILVGFEVTVPKQSKGNISVLLLPEGVSGKTLGSVKPLADWGK